jgi:hypothetical protein
LGFALSESLIDDVEGNPQSEGESVIIDEILSRPLRPPHAHSDTDPGDGGEYFRGLHTDEVEFAMWGESRSESEESSFYAEESAQFPGEDICTEGREAGQSNRL